MKTRQVIIESFGSPEVMQIKTIELPHPAPGEVLIRHEAIGFNFIDIYDREGRNGKKLPSLLGREAVGIIEAIGKGVTDFHVGDRVACVDAGLGTYSDARIISTDRLIKVPDNLNPFWLASALMKAMTVYYLLNKTYQVKENDLVLVHASAGGVGQIMCHWAKKLGATVVGTVGSNAKIDIAKNAGADIVINYSHPNWSKDFLEATNNRKANVVYDSVGKDTFFESLECVAPLGTLVISGSASGPIGEFSPSLLKKKKGGESI